MIDEQFYCEECSQENLSKGEWCYMGKIFVTPDMVRDFGIEFQQINDMLKSAVENYIKCMENNAQIVQMPVFAKGNQKMQNVFHNISQAIEAIDEYANHCIQISESFSPPDECLQNNIFW